MNNGLRFLTTPEILGEPMEYVEQEPVSAKSLSLTNFKLKAGYKEDQSRSSETGQWSGGGGSATKKPKKETRRTLGEEISSRGGTELSVDDEVRKQLAEWERMSEEVESDLAEDDISLLSNYNKDVYDRQRDYMLGLSDDELNTLRYYSQEQYGKYSDASADPMFEKWSSGSMGTGSLNHLSAIQADEWDRTLQLRNMIEDSPDLGDTILYSGTRAEHFLGSEFPRNTNYAYGNMLKEEFEKIDVDFQESMEFIVNAPKLHKTDPDKTMGLWKAKQATHLMGNRLAKEINKNMKLGVELSPKRFLSTTTNEFVGTSFAQLEHTEHDSFYTTTDRFTAGMGLVPRVVARYTGLKKGLGIAPLTASRGHSYELEVLIGGASTKVEFVGASYVERSFEMDGMKNWGIVYVDFEGVE